MQTYRVNLRLPHQRMGPRRIQKHSWALDLNSLQSEGPIPILSNSMAEICVPSIDIMNRMMEVQMHELQWLTTRQKYRFEDLTEKMDRLQKDWG